MKKAYKQLRKKLKNKFKMNINNDYPIRASVEDWIRQCGIKPKKKHLHIICKIFGSLPYPYQQAHRIEILYYLKHHKHFKKH